MPRTCGSSRGAPCHSIALDRQGIATALFGNTKAAANQLFSAAFPDWYDPNLPPIERNVEEAKRLLAEAGWVAGADGILEQNGTRFSFTMVVGKQPEVPSLAEAIQAQLADVGIEAAHVGKIRQPQPAGFMHPAEDHLLLLAVNGPP